MLSSARFQTSDAPSALFSMAQAADSRFCERADARWSGERRVRSGRKRR